MEDGTMEKRRKDMSQKEIDLDKEEVWASKWDRHWKIES